MKKLTASIFATLLTVVTVGAANADIASSGYVDTKVGEVSAKVATKAEQSDLTDLEGTVTTLSGTVSGHTTSIANLETNKADKTALSAYATTESVTSGLAGKQDKALITSTQYGTNKTSDTSYPSVKAVADAITAATENIASSDTVSALGTRVTTAEGDITALKARMDTAESDIATVEGTVGTASANATQALNNIGTLSQLTTTKKDNTVNAINEVKTAADNAASAASTAQGAVTTLTGRVGKNETNISALQSGKLDVGGTAAKATADAAGNNIVDTYATKAQIANMATEENLNLKQDKTDNSLATTAKTIVGAIGEVKTTADDALADAATAQADATQAISDAATAKGVADAAQSTANQAKTTADAAIPKPSADQINSNGVYVLTFNGTNGYAWETITR